VQAAENYLSKEIPVFPLGNNKIPIVQGWPDRTFTIQEINVPGLKGLGTCPGLWRIPVMIFDIDGEAGRKSWDTCLEIYGNLPTTFSVHTGRKDGGKHLYYRIPDDLYVKGVASVFASHIDLRGARSQGVLPPTIHKSGKQYQWYFNGEPCKYIELNEIPFLPESWIQALLENKCAYWKSEQKKKPQVEPSYSSRSSKYGLQALEVEAEKIRTTPPNTARNDNLNIAAFNMGQLVAGGELSESITYNTLLEAGLEAGLEHKETEKTLQSGFEDGKQKPRTAPKEKKISEENKQEQQEPQADPEQVKERAKKILQERQPCGPFDLSILPTILKDYVEQICERTEADPLMVLTSVLGTLSSYIGRKCYISEDQYFNKLYPNIWSLCIAPSGSFKTTALNQGARIAWQLESELQKRINELKERKLEEDITKEEKKEINKEISKLQSQSLVLPNRMSGEGLLELLSYGQAGMIPASELGEWLDNLQKSHNQGLKPLFTDLYDCPQQYSYKTRGGGHLVIQRPYISIVGFSTMQWVQNNISLSDVGSGFFARFLLFYPPQKERIPPALPESKGPFDCTTENLIKEKLDSIPEDNAMCLDSKATEYFKGIHQGIYQALKQLGERERELIRPYTKRWSPYVLKLAMIFQVITDPTQKISVEAIQAGAAVVEYAIKSTVHLFQGELGESKFQQDCRNVLEFIAKKNGRVQRNQLLASKSLDGGSKEYDEVINTLVEQDKLNTLPSESGLKKYETLQLTENIEFE